jgi:HEPN domain-containing protein
LGLIAKGDCVARQRQITLLGTLILEKLLKALIVRQTGNHAPHGHGLVALAKIADLDLTEEQTLLLRRATDYNIQARYPDHKFQLKSLATQDYCKRELKAIQDFGIWLQSMLTP